MQEVLTLFDRDQRRDIEYPGMERAVLPYLIRNLRPPPGVSFIQYCELDETTADAAIDAEMAYFGWLGQSFEWKTYAHDRPADMVDRLVARGFEKDEQDAVMVLDLLAAPEALLAEPAADVRRLTEPAQLGDVVSILEPVWGRDFGWIHERLRDHMAIPDYLSIYVAYADGTPACVGWTYFNKGHFAGLWGGSTLEPYRGRGFYTAILAARAREARDRGVSYLTIDAGSMSRPIVARHGFEVITNATSCEWKPEGA